MLAKIISLCQSKERRHHREQKNQWNFSFEDETKGNKERETLKTTKMIIRKMWRAKEERRFASNEMLSTTMAKGK